MNRSSRLSYLMLFVIIMAGALFLAMPLGAQEKISLTPEDLLKALTEGIVSLEKDIAAGKAEADTVQQRVKQEEVSLQNLQARIAALKASQAAGELQFKQAQEALEGFAKQEGEVAAFLKEAREQREKLARKLADRINAFNEFQQKVEHLKATKHPIWNSPNVRKAYSQYQQLAKQYQSDASRILKLWDQVIAALEEMSQALNNTTKELQIYVETGWKEWLLQKRTLRETVEQTWQTLGELPERLANSLSDPMLPQRVAASLRGRWAQVLGLLATLLILVWMLPRVRRMVLPKMLQWQADAEEWGLKVIFKAGELVLTHLFGLCFIAWLALVIGILGWWQKGEARIVLLGVSVWVGLRLGLRLIQAVFAGKERGGLLPFEESSVRPYRRHLKLLLVYVLLIETFGLNLLQFLNLEPTKYLNLETFILVGFMVLVYWLLRRRYLENLRSELTEPGWSKLRFFSITVRAIVLLVLVTILLTSLLGFQNLAAYVANGVSLTGFFVVLFWVTWQGAKAVLEHALFPAKMRVPGRNGRQEEILRRYSLAIGKLVVTALLVGAVLLIVKLWGVDLGFLQLFSTGLTWGVKLGPFSLNLLNLGLAILTLLMGRWFSLFLRALLEIRFYPRTDWDRSIRYTISNTCHYTIQAAAILMALSYLGLSFGDLAIVAGGLGVGIGFGLQNIVNNFVSGLILLFERPIKVGDLLVIDGQWGTVKEIRVRSTIFQTSDRSVLIIPNSELISTKVLNWTHYGPGINRLTLKVGVSYGSDVRQVTKVLQKVCRANPYAVPEPPPQIFFEAYGDRSLNFTIWVHLNSPADRIPATHDLNNAIFEAFQEQGIEFPNLQMDLHIKSLPSGSTPPPLPSNSTQ